MTTSDLSATYAFIPSMNMESSISLTRQYEGSDATAIAESLTRDRYVMDDRPITSSEVQPPAFVMALSKTA